MGDTQLSIAITGAGGAGVISCGELLLKAWAHCGGRGLLRKAFGPQIRGGEAAALLKFTGHERYTAAARYDIIVALDWVNFDRFQDEIIAGPDTVVICEDSERIPSSLKGLPVIHHAFAQLASSSHPEGRMNMVAAGFLGHLLQLPMKALLEQALTKLANKPEAYRDGARACIASGYAASRDIDRPLPARDASGAWCLTGNQAAGFGALSAGVRFAAAYPITPASDALEWLAGGLEAVGGHLMQAEDELAAINMTIGAAFGGVPAFTATSGPGLALMSESLGLAVASETPLTLLNVMRGGPSTGIPTKSEQADLDIALYGLHGDAPHLVLAALDIPDCAFTTAWAVQLAQALQVPAIVLSDQFLGQSTAVVAPPRLPSALSAVEPTPSTTDEYLRYRLTASGVSTLAHPGDADARYTADGLEHNERGTPSARASDHREQLDKRRRKLEAFYYGADWGRCDGKGDTALVSFGSASAAVDEAAALLAEEGTPVRTVALRLLAPLPATGLALALAGCSHVLVVEQNHSAQLYHYLKGRLDLPLESLAISGPVPLNPHTIADAVGARQDA